MTATPGIEVRAAVAPELAHVLTPDALAFVAGLHRQFEPERQAPARTRAHDARRSSTPVPVPISWPSTADVRAAEWRVGRARRGPAWIAASRSPVPCERKMMVNALNSGARVFMADLEDALAPSWSNVIVGQSNLRDAVRRELDFDSPEGKRYALNAETATLLVRPRGWHLAERHVLVDGEPISASLFDFGLYLFHNAARVPGPRSRSVPRPVLLPAQAGEPPRGTPLERRLRGGPGDAGHPARARSGRPS